jgi:hypothetical protein
MTRPWSPVQVKQWSEHDSKSPRTKPEKMTNSEDLARKVMNFARQGASSNSERNRRQGPTCKRGEDLEDAGSNTRRRRPQTGPRWAKAGRPSLFRGPVGLPFDLVASRAIYSPLTKSHASINLSFAAEEQRSLRDTISEMRVVLVV